MIETIIKCDVCQNPAKSYRAIVGKTMDASGNGYENDYKYFDYCFDHLLEFARKNPEIIILEN